MDPAFGAALGSFVTGIVTVCVTLLTLRQTKRSTVAKSLHDRRIEHVEKLYSAIEVAVREVLTEIEEPDQGPYGFDELKALRETHYPARIHLPDDVDRLSLDLIEELDRAFAAAVTSSEFGWTDVNKIPEEALRQMRGFKESAELSRAIRDKLRVALRDLLRRPV